MDQRSPGQPPAEKEGGHRGLGDRPIEPPGFWSDFRHYPQLFLFVLFVGLIAMGQGIETALNGDLGLLTRTAGAASAAAGALIWLSYILYRKPGPLASPPWQQVPSRRRAAFVLRHLWLGALVITPAAWLAHWIATR